jgi:hypothetical protein
MTSARNIELAELLVGLNSDARTIALGACRSYKHRDLEIKRIKRELAKDRALLKRGRQTLKNLGTVLGKLDANVGLTTKLKMQTLGELVRANHVPPDASIPLKSFFRKYFWLDYFKNEGLPDPAEPLVQLCEAAARFQRFVLAELGVLDKRIRLTVPTRRDRVMLFSRNGSLQYVLSVIFQQFATPRLTKKQIEEKIAKILNVLDKGGASVDEIGHGCAAVRMAIKRLDNQYKHRCDRYLAVRFHSLS